MIWLAAAVALLVFLLLLPVGIRVSCDELAARVQACFGPVKLTLIPRKKKSGGPKAAPAHMKKTADNRGKKKISFAAEDIFSLLRTVTEFLGGFRRKLRIPELTVRAVFGGADPAVSALNYGRAWALIGAITPILENHFRIEKRNVSAHWDPEADAVSLSMCFVIMIRLGALLTLALRAATRVILILINKKRRCKP